jgi:hypothetical protein
MNRYGKMFRRAILRHYKAGETRPKQMDKINNICDQSIIVKGNAELRQISNRLCDSVEIHVQGDKWVQEVNKALKTTGIAETKSVAVQ